MPLPQDIEKMFAQSGRLIREDNTQHNWADDLAFRARYSLLYQTVQNGAVEFSKRTSIASADSLNPFYYALNIPPGRRFFLWQRSLFFTQGAYDVDLVRFPSGVTGGVQAFKSTLTQDATPTVGTNVLCGVTPVVPGEGEVLAEFPRVDTGSDPATTRRVGGAAANDAVLKSYIDGSQGTVLLRVQRIGTAGDFVSSFGMVGWEEDAQ